MMEKLKNLASWKIILPLFLLFSVFTFYLFPKYQNAINKIAGKELQSLDARANYNKTDVMQLFDSMGKEGISIYSFVSGTIDAVYPLVYGALFFFLTIALTKRLNNKSVYLSFISIFAVVSDYLENFHVLELMGSYPSISEEQVGIASTFTQLKWAFLLLSLGTIVILLIVFALKKFIHKDQ